MSPTQIWTPFSEPGTPSPMPLPTMIEQPDPGGVNWTIRTPSIGLSSTSTSKPNLSA
jgi:hypothetical protein